MIKQATIQHRKGYCLLFATYLESLRMNRRVEIRIVPDYEGIIALMGGS